MLTMSVTGVPANVGFVTVNENNCVYGGGTPSNNGMGKVCKTGEPPASVKLICRTVLVPGARVPLISTVNVICGPKSVTPGLERRSTCVVPLFCKAVTLLNVIGSAFAAGTAARQQKNTITATNPALRVGVIVSERLSLFVHAARTSGLLIKH
jgi:hypothetical protein